MMKSNEVVSKDVALILMSAYVDDIIRENNISADLAEYNITVECLSAPLSKGVEDVLEMIYPGLCYILCELAYNNAYREGPCNFTSVDEIYESFIKSKVV